MILDDGGDATLLIHLGVKCREGSRRALEQAVAATRSSQSLFAAIKRRLGYPARLVLGVDQDRRQGMRGVTEETTTGVHRLYQMAQARAS